MKLCIKLEVILVLIISYNRSVIHHSFMRVLNGVSLKETEANKCICEN